MAKKATTDVICSCCIDSFPKKTMYIVQRNGYNTWCCEKCIKTFKYESISESPKTK